MCLNSGYPKKCYHYTFDTKRDPSILFPRCLPEQLLFPRHEQTDHWPLNGELVSNDKHGRTNWKTWSIAAWSQITGHNSHRQLHQESFQFEINDMEVVNTTPETLCVVLADLQYANVEWWTKFLFLFMINETCDSTVV